MYTSLYQCSIFIITYIIFYKIRWLPKRVVLAMNDNGSYGRIGYINLH